MMLDGVFPFSLHGLEFLQFYGVLCLILLVVQGWRQNAQLPTAAGASLSLAQVPAKPYRIAWLRGGAEEVVRVALFSLFDRGLLASAPPGAAIEAETPLVTVGGGEARRVREPVERALLEHFGTPRTPLTITGSPSLQAAAAAYEQELIADGMVLGPAAWAARRRLLGLVLLGIWGIAGLRIAQTLDHGKHNFTLLLVVATIASVFALIVKARRPAVARQYLRNARRMFAGARVQARDGTLAPGRSNRELTAVAAVFGLAVLPLALFPLASLFARQSQDSGGDSGSDSGSSDSGSSCSSSSDSGSSCGSSCGGSSE